MFYFSMIVVLSLAFRFIRELQWDDKTYAKRAQMAYERDIQPKRTNVINAIFGKTKDPEYDRTPGPKGYA